MGQLNDKVLTTIALQYGDNQAMESPNLIAGILPVVESDDYRQRLFNIRGSFVPPGAVAGSIQFVMICPVDERWRVVQGSSGNQGAAGIILTSFVRPAGGGSGQKIFVPMFRRIPTLSDVVIVGPGIANTKDMAVDEFVPAFIDIPSGAELSVTLTDEGGGDLDNFVRTIVFQVLRLPPTQEWSARAFNSVLGPV